MIYKNLIGSVAKLYHEKGMSLSEINDLAKTKDLSVNWYKTAEDLYFEGFSIRTILSLYKEEGLKVPEIEKFLSLIQQPTRANGGYEKSRDLIYNNFTKQNEKHINYTNNTII